MKVWRGFTLALWIALMTTCVSLVAVYYILAQTILSPVTAKKWLNESGVYGQLAEVVVPKLTPADDSTATTNGLITPDMLQRATKLSIKPADVKAKVEPIIDATYAWLDSKSPDITFSVSIGEESERFLQALRREVRAKIESLPECSGYVDPAELERASCRPWYVSTDSATDTIMAKIEQQDIFRDKKLSPDTLAGKTTVTPGKNIPELLSLLWVIQLVAMPVAGLAALFVIVKRRAAGLTAVGVSLLTPGLGLLVIGLLLHFGGGTAITDFVEKSDFAAVAAPLGRVIAQSFATITLQVGGILSGIGIVAVAAGIWWWRRRRHSK